MRTRPLDGLLTGLAAAGVAGVAWWASAVFIEWDYWHYLALLVGLIIGEGVLLGARRGGAVTAVLAVVLSCATIAVTIYFIDRSLLIQAYADAGRTSDIPLWQGFSYAIDVVREGATYDKAKSAGWLLAPLAALLSTAWPSRRPVVG